MGPEFPIWETQHLKDSSELNRGDTRVRHPQGSPLLTTLFLIYVDDLLYRLARLGRVRYQSFFRRFDHVDNRKLSHGGYGSKATTSVRASIRMG